MKLARLIGLMCVAAMATFALAGSSTAMAETTALCSVEEVPCEESNHIKKIGFEADDLTVLTSVMDYKCDSSFSANVSELGEPQTLEVTAMEYTSCDQGCTRTVTELGTFTVSRTGEEVGEVAGSGFKVVVKCGSLINCTYTFDELIGTIQGASLTGDNGHITFSEALFIKSSGILCPKTAKLDALFIASEPVYVSS
jgi:hypothetical protein